VGGQVNGWLSAMIAVTYIDACLLCVLYIPVYKLAWKGAQRSALSTHKHAQIPVGLSNACVRPLGAAVVRFLFVTN
jgi:hypothetical protein